MSRPTIFFVGEVSSGKSSLLNAIAGGIISNASIQRETIYPEFYKFVSNEETKSYPLLKKYVTLLEKKHVKNKNFNLSDKTTIDNISPIITTDSDGDLYYLKAQFGLRDFFIADFPGLNDSADANDSFFNLVSDNIDACDILAYITKAESAFVSQSEIELFKKIKALCDDRRNKYGQHIELCIIINKFDDPYDSDLIEIANEIPNKLLNNSIDDTISIFKISSHKLFIHNIVTHKVSVPVPKFINKEIQKIFQNANVIMTKDQKKSIKEHGKISHKYIQFNEDIDKSDSGDENDNNSSEKNHDDNGDSGSDFEDNYQETNKEKPVYNYECEGDWNCFINFIRMIDMQMPYKRRDAMRSLIDKYFTDFLDCEFNNENNVVQQLAKYHYIHDNLKNQDDIDYFIDATVNCVSYLFDRSYIIQTVSFVYNLFVYKISFTTNQKIKLCQLIFNLVNINVDKCGWKFWNVFVVAQVMYNFKHYNPELTIKMLQSKHVWELSTINDVFSYYSTKGKCFCENYPCEKYGTQIVQNILVALASIYGITKDQAAFDICSLITITRTDINHSKILEINNKIPFDIIEKFLGRKAVIRYQMYIHNNVIYDNHIPILFNNDPDEPINKKVEEYLELENNRFLIR